MQLQDLINFFKRCGICENRLDKGYAEIVYQYKDSLTGIPGSGSINVCSKCADKLEDAKNKADSMGDLGEDYREQDLSE